MAIDSEGFKDYARRGMDAVIDGVKSAAGLVREAGDGAIDRVDMLRLERRLEGARAVLGAVAFTLLESGMPVTSEDPEVAAAVGKVKEASAALERRRAAFASRNGSPEDAGKNKTEKTD